MDITVVLNSECAGKTHLHLSVTVTSVAGTRTFSMTIPRHEWLNDVIDGIPEEELVKLLIRHWFKTDNPPAGQFKTRLEAKVFKY